MAERRNEDSLHHPEALPHLQATYIADPLCCWSYGMQPAIDQLQDSLGDQLSLRLVMGGMLPSWNRFYDEANSVSRPVQMGPVWMHAAQITGRKINHLLWMKDAPASSYPACIAVTSARLQSAEAALTCFRLLQDSALGTGNNIASWPVIQAVAAAVAKLHPAFDVQQFEADHQHGPGAKAFQEDLAVAASYRATRFPTLLLEADQHRGIVLAGYRSYNSIKEAITKAFPQGDRSGNNAL